jgi:hypothetical protein
MQARAPPFLILTLQQVWGLTIAGWPPPVQLPQAPGARLSHPARETVAPAGDLMRKRRGEHGCDQVSGGIPLLRDRVALDDLAVTGMPRSGTFNRSSASG